MSPNSLIAMGPNAEPLRNPKWRIYALRLAAWQSRIVDEGWTHIDTLFTTAWARTTWQAYNRLVKRYIQHCVMKDTASPCNDTSVIMDFLTQLAHNSSPTKPQLQMATTAV